MAVYSSGGELIHHGILGMKWGVRRYQNKDGTLTRAGKKRAKQLREAADKRNTDEKILDQYSRELSNNAERVAKSEIKNLTDDELKMRVARIKLENEYKQLAYPAIEENNSRKKKSKDLVSKILRDSTENIGTQAATFAMGSAINALAKSLGIEDDDIVNPYKGQGDRPKKKNDDDSGSSKFDKKQNDKKSEGNFAIKQKPKNSRDSMGKDISAMTDDEISSLISRLNNERSLQQLFDGAKSGSEKKSDDEKKKTNKE